MPQDENNEGRNNKILHLKNITLTEILRSLWRYKLLVIPAVIIGAVMGYISAATYYNNVKDIERYSVTTSLLVESKRGDTSEYISGGENVSVSDFSIAKSIITQVKFMMKTDRMLNDLIEKTGVKTSPGALKGAIDISQYEDTQILIVTLRWVGKSEDALKIINAISEILPPVLMETLKMGSVSVIDSANTPSRLYYSMNYSSVIYGAGSGIVVSLIICVILGLLRPTIYNKEEIQRYFSLDTLGEIPYYSNIEKNKYFLISNDEAPFELVEAYRMLGSIFRHVMETKNYKTVYVTSSMANEGKTAVTTNLAVTMANSEKKKVLLIDFDTRKPQLRTALNIKRDRDNRNLNDIMVNKSKLNDNKSGEEKEERNLNNVFYGKITLEEAIISVNDYLDVICSDISDDVIMTKEMADQINAIKDRYDYIFFDTPPVGIVSDALALNSCVDSAMFIMKYDFVTIDLISSVINKIRQSGIDVIGCVLNNIKQNRIARYYTSRYYNKYGYYSYGYGYKQGTHRSSGRRYGGNDKKYGYGYLKNTNVSDENIKIKDTETSVQNKNTK